MHLRSRANCARTRLETKFQSATPADMAVQLGHKVTISFDVIRDFSFSVLVVDEVDARTHVHYVPVDSYVCTYAEKFPLCNSAMKSAKDFGIMLD